MKEGTKEYNKEKVHQAVREYKAGDIEKFDDIYNLSLKMMFNYLKKACKNIELAEDLTQETYIEISKKLYQLNDIDSFEGWAKSIAKNKFYAHCKKHKEILLNEENLFIFEEIKEDKEILLPEDSMENKETQRLIREIINNLPLTQSIIVQSYYIDGEKLKDIAISLDIPLGTVKSSLNSARKKIKIEVESLEKKHGTKLYNISLGAFLVFIFEQDIASMEVPKEIYEEIKNNLIKEGVIKENLYPTNNNPINNSSNIGKNYLRKSIISSITKSSAIKIASLVVATGVTAGALVMNNNKNDKNNNVKLSALSSISTSTENKNNNNKGENLHNSNESTQNVKLNNNKETESASVNNKNLESKTAIAVNNQNIKNEEAKENNSIKEKIQEDNNIKSEIGYNTNNNLTNNNENITNNQNVNIDESVNSNENINNNLENSEEKNNVNDEYVPEIIESGLKKYSVDELRQSFVDIGWDCLTSIESFGYYYCNYYSEYSLEGWIYLYPDKKMVLTSCIENKTREPFKSVLEKTLKIIFPNNYLKVFNLMMSDTLEYNETIDGLNIKITGDYYREISINP